MVLPIWREKNVIPPPPKSHELLADGVRPSVCLSVCLSVCPISSSLYTLLTSNHHCIFTMPSTCTSHYYFVSLTFDLGAVTFTLTCYRKIAWTKHPINAKMVHLLHFANISWFQRAVTLIDRWPTFQGHIGHRDLWLFLLVQYCPNKTSHQCQNGTFGEFYQYLGWPLTYFSMSDRSARLVCLSIQFLLADIYDWHKTITAYLPCPVLVPHTIILALWPWHGDPDLDCLLPQIYLNQTSNQYQNGTFAAFCQYLG